MKKGNLFFFLAAFFLLSFFTANSAFGKTFRVFGPEDFTRDNGKPATISRDFEVLNPNTTFYLKIYNGGSKKQFEKMTSAIITLNGTQIVAPHEFKKHIDLIEKPVGLNLKNKLVVELRGTPGSGFSVEIEGDDNEPPLIRSVSIPPPNSSGWNNSDVTVSFECMDTISGIASCSQPVTVDAEGANQLIFGKAIDNAGNSSSTSIAINIDKSPPIIRTSFDRNPNSNGWFNNDVVVTFSCSDTLSGVASCTPPSVISTEGVNLPASGTALDLAGNSARTTVTVNTDKVPPKITITSPSNGSSSSNSAIRVEGTVVDMLSGVASITCNGLPAQINGSHFACDLSIGAGENQIVVFALDNAGHADKTKISVNGTFVPTLPQDIKNSLEMLPHAEAPVIGADGIPTFIQGNIAEVHVPPTGISEQDLQPVLGQIAPIFRLQDATLALGRIEKDMTGITHARYQQFKYGLAVVGGELIIHVNPYGLVFSVNGTARDGIDITPEPAFTEDKAEMSALSMYALNNVLLTRKRLVYIIANVNRVMHLAHELTIEGQNSEGLPIRDRVYIDAKNGELVDIHSEIHDVLNRSIYSAGGTSNLPGILLRTEGQKPAGDSAADTNYDDLGIAYNFFDTVFARDSYDNNSASIVSTIHFGNMYNNAFWDGTQFVFGDGDGVSFGNFALALDVTTHELTHAITDKTSRLVYGNEAGALSEAMSDILAASCEAWRDGAITSNTWLLGEDIYTPTTPGDALRYLDDPAKDGISKDFYPEMDYPGYCIPICDDKDPGYNDCCGVHTNSGIANLAFKLLTTGGTHPRSKTTAIVPSIGIEKARHIFYDANAYYLTSGSSFEDARWATANAAKFLYDDETARALHAAWDAVAVPGSVPAPWGLSAAAGDGEVSLTWIPVLRANSYNVKRGTSLGGPYMPIETGVSSNSSTDTEVQNGTTYFYVVSAVAVGNIEGPDSLPASATPLANLPSVPSNLLGDTGDGCATLSWNSVAGATGYKIKRSSADGGPYFNIATVSDTSYFDSGLTNGQPYYYVVSAVNSGGESANSNQVLVIPEGVSSCSPPDCQKFTATVTGSALENCEVTKPFEKSIVTTWWTVFSVGSTQGQEITTNVELSAWDPNYYDEKTKTYINECGYYITFIIRILDNKKEVFNKSATFDQYRKANFTTSISLDSWISYEGALSCDQGQAKLTYWETITEGTWIPSILNYYVSDFVSTDVPTKDLGPFAVNCQPSPGCYLSDTDRKFSVSSDNPDYVQVTFSTSGETTTTDRYAHIIATYGSPPPPPPPPVSIEYFEIFPIPAYRDVNFAFRINRSAQVTIKIFTLDMNLVDELSGSVDGGQDITWSYDTRGRLSSGTYFAVFYAGDQHIIEKFIVIH